MEPHMSRTRYALVGTGARAQLYVRSIADRFAEHAELVALLDPNSTRLAAHQRLLTGLGAAPAATHDPSEFTAALDKHQVDKVIVTSVDRTHDEYIVAALKAGRGVITEKPMTVDVPRCQRILDTVRDTGGDVTVTFNYRYNPVHEKVREVIAAGEIGEVGSVHFEWLLDLRHGADYFRRWHRDRANSGGLLVHKASHHFDLVNWWIGATPEAVHAFGRLFFYGPEAGARHGYARDYARAHGSPAAQDDPFAVRLADNPQLRELYLDAEHEDGYLRDQNVFAPGVTIEDDMTAVVRYSTGATMSYHLHAYSPWEGYRLMVNGSRGRLELEVVENDHVEIEVPSRGNGGSGDTGPRPVAGLGVRGASLHGEAAPKERGSVRLTVHPFWAPAREIALEHSRGGHGGADGRMTERLFDPAVAATPDPLGRGATATDGALALLTGLAANHSIRTGAATRVADLLDLT
jgi:predicted dehydrogenase